MPVITYEGSKLTKEQKAELIRRFSEVAHETTKINQESFIVFIHENDTDNIGVGGEVLTDRLKK